MCSLCGMLADRGHWSESASSPEAFAGHGRTRLRERQDRTRLINRVLAHYGLTLQDWSGNAYILRSRTGQSAIVPHLGSLWAEAERLAHRPCDPLDPALLADLPAGPDRSAQP